MIRKLVKADGFAGAVYASVIALTFIVEACHGIYQTRTHGVQVEINGKHFAGIAESQRLIYRTGGFSNSTIYSNNGTLEVIARGGAIGRMGAVRWSTIRQATEAEQEVWHKMFGPRWI